MMTVLCKPGMCSSSTIDVPVSNSFWSVVTSLTNTYYWLGEHAALSDVLEMNLFFRFITTFNIIIFFFIH